MDKVSMNAQRMKQRRVSVETENPSLGGYLHRRRWSSDSIHHFTEALHLSFHWKRRTTLPVVTLGAEGEVTPPPLHHKHGHTHSSFISFTRTVSATLRKRKNPIPALAVVVLEDGVVELVRILLFIIVLDFVFFVKYEVVFRLQCFYVGSMRMWIIMIWFLMMFMNYALYIIQCLMWLLIRHRPCNSRVSMG